MKVEIIVPHGLCAGVNGAIAKALKLRGVYCLHELVHNEIVIAELRDLGFTFVDDIEDVPEGETVVFSAHGVPPRVHEIASARKLKVVDTTCPFVLKVHRAARDFAERGLPVVIIGDPKHLLTTIEALEAKTAQFDRQFIVAISYGGRAEIVDAVNAVVKAGEPVTEETFIALVFGQHRAAVLTDRVPGEYSWRNERAMSSAYEKLLGSKVDLVASRILPQSLGFAHRVCKEAVPV